MSDYTRKYIERKGEEGLEYYSKLTRKCLDVLGCSYNTLAELIGVSKSLVQRWIEKKAEPKRFHRDFMESVCKLEKRLVSQAGSDDFQIVEGALYKEGEIRSKLKHVKTTEIVAHILLMSMRSYDIVDGEIIWHDDSEDVELFNKEIDRIDGLG